MRVHPLAPLVALDIDATLADYHSHFLWFAQLYAQRTIELDWSISSEFSEALGLEKEEYRDMKLAFRQGGMKRFIPTLDMGVQDLVPSIRQLGVQVWICTTRPWQRLDNIDPDTQFWIERNIGEIDGLIYGEDKYLDLLDIVGHDRVLGAIDDLPENILRAQSLGIRTMIRAGGHNANWRKRSPANMGKGISKPAVATHSVDIFNQVKYWKDTFHG